MKHIIKESFMPKAYQAIMLVICIVAMSFAPHRDKNGNDEIKDFIMKYKSVDATIYDSRKLEKSFKMAQCIYDDDSLSSYIARNIHYPYNLLGDSKNVFYNFQIKVDTCGNVSDVVSCKSIITDRKNYTQYKKDLPELTAEAEQVLKTLKFDGPSMCYDSTTCKWVPDTGCLQVSFNIVPYPVEKIDNRDSVVYYLNLWPGSYYCAYPGFGNKFPEWVLQQKFVKMASVDEKIDSALHSKNSAIRMIAFQDLVDKKHSLCTSIVCQALNDQSRIRTIGGCLINEEYLADFMLRCFYEDGRFCSEEDSLMLDSVVFYSPQIKDLDYRESLICKLALTPERYERFRELYMKDNYGPALVSLAKYKRSQDKALIIKALQEYSKGLDSHGTKNGKPVGMTNYALEAVAFMPDNAFIPSISKIANFETKRKYYNYARQRLLFQAIMAYDNDWAYNFINNFFRRPVTEYLHKALYSAYYKSKNKHKRFLPLVKKYGKK